MSERTIKGERAGRERGEEGLNITASEWSFTIGGVPFPASGITVSREAVVHETQFRQLQDAYEVSATMTIEGEGLRALEQLLFPPIRGATDAVLARRVHYGGRKGRSAMRRLLRRGFVGTMTINGGPPMPAPPFQVRWGEEKQR